MKKKLIKAISLVLFMALMLQSLCFGASAANVFLLGDADRNGEINAYDARYILRTAVGLNRLTDANLKICDADENGSIEAADARIVLRVAVKLQSLDGKTVELTDSELENNLTENVITVPVDGALPDAPEIEAVPGTFTFTVYGNGHGVGLSQIGAIYLANEGYSYADILGYYYKDSILIEDDYFPQTTKYKGVEYDTNELVARIVSGEIGEVPEEAVKAQAVAVYTLLRRCDFNDESGQAGALFSNGVWASDYGKNVIAPAVSSVLGQYVARRDDLSGEPVLTVYSAMAAGKTVSCSDIWYADYPVSVDSPFEMSAVGFVHNAGPYTAEEIKERILKYDSTIVLPSDPAKWFDILSHNASISADVGYVTQLLVGDTVLSGVEAISKIIDLASGCYTITYTPM